MNNLINIRKVVKGDNTYYNIYLFGVLVKCVYANEYSKLYYSAKEYCRSNGIEIKEIVKDVEEDKKHTSK